MRTLKIIFIPKLNRKLQTIPNFKTENNKNTLIKEVCNGDVTVVMNSNDLIKNVK